MHNKKSAAIKPRLNETSPSRLDWDDLRYVLAVARNGSLSGAARTLAVTHSTMLRRIDAIETKLQVRLFERLRHGYVVTDAGDMLCRTAEQCEPLVAEAERLVVGGDMRLTGSLRVTTAYVLGQHLLPHAVAKFCSMHPQIEVELLTARERIDLSRREADIAVRMSPDVPDYLVGRKLGDVRLRIYAWHAAPFLKGVKRPKLRTIPELAETLPWICFEREARDRSYDRWVHANIPDTSVKVRADHFPGALALLRTGIGVTLLPEFVAQDAGDLVPMSAPIEELQTPLWVLTHPDLRNTARVRAFLQTVGDELASMLRQRRLASE